MSDPTAPVEGTPTSAAPEAAPAPTQDAFAPLVDRMGELASSIDSRFAAFEQRLPQPEPEPEPDHWAALYPELAEEEPAYEPQPQLDINALQNAVSQQVQQAVTPYQQQLQQLQAERSREQLLQRIPALNDPVVAQQTIDGMVQSLQKANAAPEFIQWALSNPDQIALHFEAAEAKKLAAGQAPATSEVPNVETAGGAAPGGNGTQPNIVHQVMRSRAQGLPPGFG